MRLLRTLSGLTIAAVCLAGCGGSNGGSASPAATPQFVDPAAQASSAGPASAPVEAAPSAPASASAGPSASAKAKPSASASASAATKPASVKYVFPVDASNVDWSNTHSKYPGTDLFVNCGSRFVATTSGVVLEVSLKDTYVEGNPDGPANGGLSVSIMGDDGVRYYGSHLSKVQSGIEAGARVKAGQLLGLTGKTGNASNVCHLHYGVSAPCAKTGDWKVRRGVVWPYTYLASWRAGGQKSPVEAVTAWEKKSGCKA
ncbi:M23 family metallopeptidase [Actinoplanes sp. NEAU-A12]|uniref:M23 family metallopeptidase n=1 Tax=Actinoplanes sandaracinus TaxID=3045177 RepID=A0ABT6WTR4_9ACTN|nr:M23 family metallopeptidase [Actinoplanes sandaracinus]MDI6103136.1 M23 family metallopeptidase [Actinoplanes sandaracinus]